MIIRIGGPVGRPGTIVTLLAFTLVGMLGFLALAIDLGMLAIAKTQSQNAADLAALAAARTLNGTSVGNYNNAAATANAQAILSYNLMLGQPIQASQLTLTYGSYDYNQSTQAFVANYPPTTGMAWTAVASTVTSNNLPGAFSTVFGSQFLPNVSSTAQAAHRPRDIALSLDLSGSMLLGTCLGFDPDSWTRVTNNPDPLAPSYGHYATNSSLMISAGTNRTNSSNYTISPTNSTVPNASYSLTYVNSFYQSAAYASTLIRAFDSYTSTDGGITWSAPSGGATPQLPPASYAASPGGDMPLFTSGSTTTYAKTVNDVLGKASTNTAANIMWELDGYSAYAAGKPDTSGTNYTPQVWAQTDYRANAGSPANNSLPFNGYTQGPGYYGKTFFLWPPDPRNTTVPSGTTLTNYLTALGVSTSGSPSDVQTLVLMWPTWQSQGATGLANLQTWLKQGSTASNGDKSNLNYYTSTASAAYVGGSTTITWNGWTAAPAPKTYYAVCRLFNRAYPGGTAWTSSANFSADWRTRFFGTNTTYGNSYLFNSSGALNAPGSNGTWPGSGSSAASSLLTYNAILQWLNQAPNSFPTQMRAGRINYYGSIPTTITGTWPSYGSTDQQFWVQIIDNALGFLQTGSASYWDLSGLGSTGSLIGYGSDFAWGTVSIGASPNPPAPSPASAPQAYMNYTDNPGRPLLRFWLGPLLMTDYFHNNNYTYANMSGYYYSQPGDCYEAPGYSAKQAYLAAINLMQSNHPNDWFTIVPYSQSRGGATSTGRNNNASCPLGTNYAYASSALLYPFSTINADGSCNNTEVTPFDADPATGNVPSANFADVPRSYGGTSFAMALMLIHNQFAVTPTTDTTLRTFVTNSPINFPTGMAGGLGRKGAQKLVIFETDGMADMQAAATLTTNGTYTYYPIQYDMNRPNTSYYPTGNNYTAVNDSTTLNQVYSYIIQLRATYGTTRNPFRLYTIGYGPVFSGTDSANALGTLVAMQNYANGTPYISNLPANQIITGTDAQMSANMISAFTSILNNGVQIALIK